MNSIEDLLKLCNLEQRLLVERVMKFTEDREAKCAEREADLRKREETASYLTHAFFKEFVGRHMDSMEQWTRWKENILKHYEKEDEGTGR